MLGEGNQGYHLNVLGNRWIQFQKSSFLTIFSETGLYVNENELFVYISVQMLDKVIAPFYPRYFTALSLDQERAVFGQMQLFSS